MSSPTTGESAYVGDLEILVIPFTKESTHASPKKLEVHPRQKLATSCHPETMVESYQIWYAYIYMIYMYKYRHISYV